MTSRTPSLASTFIVLVVGTAALISPACHRQRAQWPSSHDLADDAETGATATAEGSVDAGESGTQMVEEWVRVPVSVLYPSGGAELDAPGRELVRELSASLAHRDDVVGIRIEGHADTNGSNRDNHRLGLARANNVAEQLAEELGLETGSLEVQSHGDERPITSETTSADRIQNQRVEVSVLVRRRRPAAPAPSPAYHPVYRPASPPSAPPAVYSPTSETLRSLPRLMPSAPMVVAPSITASPLLTAAVVDDADRRGAYLSYLSRHPSERIQTRLDMSRRVRIRVVDGRNRPIHDAQILLEVPGARIEGRTHADGIWDFFPNVTVYPNEIRGRLTVVWGRHRVAQPVAFPAVEDARDIVIGFPPETVAIAPSRLDLVFAIDVTGSMGDELHHVTEEVVGIVERVRRSVPQVDVRLGATLYRDAGDDEPLRIIPFTTNAAGFANQLRSTHAHGGGDYPEDLNAGLSAAMGRLHWSSRQAVRVLVVISDAPPQSYPDSPYTYLDAMVDASRRGVRILPVAASGSDRLVEYLFRAMGAMTSTPYIYLTNDSGVGDHHMEADTDRIAVEMLSDLLTRLIISDLQGFGMHDPMRSQQG